MYLFAFAAGLVMSSDSQFVARKYCVLRKTAITILDAGRACTAPERLGKQTSGLSLTHKGASISTQARDLTFANA
jgi:hypothetical protein